jgi:N-acetylglucosaminyldiphosphoundecaprenol N-acetyl-beta-D-mannosaminyltransferase
LKLQKRTGPTKVFEATRTVLGDRGTSADDDDRGPLGNTASPGVAMTRLSFDLLGLRLSAMTKRDLLGAVADAIDHCARRVIANHNLHSLYLWCHEPKTREFYRSADYTEIDGMPLVLLGRLFGLPLRREHRTTNLDLLPMLLDEAARRRWRVFYLGSKPGVAERGARILRTRYPGLQISTHHGHFDTDRSGEDNKGVLTEIRQYAPDILMVGMGMPRQEIWILENREDIAAHAILCCGGLMDLVAGEIPTAPRWLGPLGLEWLYRLVSEPTRLWRRYLVEPWSVLLHLTRQYLKAGRPGGTAYTTTDD